MDEFRHEMEDFSQIPEGSIARAYTCARCEVMINFEEISEHECIRGYTNVHLDDNFYFYGATDNHTITRPNAMPNGREDVQEIAGKSKNNNSIPRKKKRTTKLSDDETESFIIAVQMREALWNFTLHPESRDRDLVRRQWEEVCAEIGGKLTAEEARSKFKSLRDTHRRIINAENCASGSARVDPEKRWKFYEVMEFLRDSCLIRDSSTNIPPSDDEGGANIPNVESAMTGDGDEANDWESPRRRAANGRNARKSADKSSNGRSSSLALDRLVDVISREPQPINIPPPPQMDTVDSMLHAAGLEIRRISNNTERMRLLMDIMTVVISRVQEQGDVYL